MLQRAGMSWKRRGQETWEKLFRKSILGYVMKVRSYLTVGVVEVDEMVG